MSEFLGSILWLVVSLGVLVTIHEFGHYWVARRCGIRVLRFSVGFGRPLWMWRGHNGTEYAIAAIPLGGYVRMLDEREGPVAPAERHEAFNVQSVWKRLAVVLAGPFANLILCVALLWGMFVIGRPDFAPVVGHVERLAETSGLRAGDTILAVGERATPTWSEVQMALLPRALDRADTALDVRTADGTRTTRTLQLSRMPDGFDERRAIEVIGLSGRHDAVEPVIGRVHPDTAAWGVLAEGDRITALDGVRITDWRQLTDVVTRVGERGDGTLIEVERRGDRLALELSPRRIDDGAGGTRWALGVEPTQQARAPSNAMLRHGPVEAIPAAFAEAVHQGRELFAMIGRAFTGRVSVQNTVAGPITIARAANAFAANGPAWYLSLLAMLSLSLGILNLLPIPVLDGGHVLYYLIELVKGSPVSERVMAAGQYVGLALIAGLMGLAFYNDIVNNLLR